MQGRRPRATRLRAARRRAASPTLGARHRRPAHRRARRLLPATRATARGARRGRLRRRRARRAPTASSCRRPRPARAAAFLITNAEGGGAAPARPARAAPRDFEPLSRDRFLAGALLPAAWVAQAQRVRRCYRAAGGARCSSDVDVLLAPATPCAAHADRHRVARDRRPAPAGAAEHGPADAADLVHRPAGLRGAGVGLRMRALPIGVQLIAAPWREDLVLRVAARICSAPASLRAPVAAADASTT